MLPSRRQQPNPTATLNVLLAAAAAAAVSNHCSRSKLRPYHASSGRRRRRHDIDDLRCRRVAALRRHGDVIGRCCFCVASAAAIVGCRCEPVVKTGNRLRVRRMESNGGDDGGNGFASSHVAFLHLFRPAVDFSRFGHISGVDAGRQQPRSARAADAAQFAEPIESRHSESGSHRFSACAVRRTVIHLSAGTLAPMYLHVLRLKLDAAFEGPVVRYQTEGLISLRKHETYTQDCRDNNINGQVDSETVSY